MEKSEIRKIRKKLGWSQERFAREIGVSWITVQRWESGDGEAHIAPENMNKIVALANHSTPPTAK